MDILGYFLQALTPTNLIWMTIGSLVGALLGALPGMSADTGIVLFLPITFNLEPSTGLITLAAIYVSGSYGGNITAVLVNTPGTSDSLFMVFDGYPMTLRGEGARAIGITTWGAFFGGVVGGFALLFVAPPLAILALKFGPFEMFLTTMMGIVIILSICGDRFIKGMISACLGLLLACVGIDKFSGLHRFSFGILQIEDRMPLLPVVLGLFAVSQMFVLAASHRESIVMSDDVMKGSSPFLSFKDIWKLSFNIFRAALIGTVVGIIPAAGTTVAAGISYNLAKKGDPDPSSFGKGNEQGLACVSAANNAVVGGSLVPLITLGIPGNGTAAIFLGGLLIHGLNPGLELFTAHPDTVYPMMTGLIIANIFILLVGLFGGRFFSKITTIPNSILIPIIGCFSILGVYAFRYLIFDMYLTLIFGVVGYYMSRTEIPMAPFVLAFVLGANAEVQLRRTITLYGNNVWGLLTQPIGMVLLLIDLLFLVWPILDMYKSAKKRKKAAAQQ